MQDQRKAKLWMLKPSLLATLLLLRMWPGTCCMSHCLDLLLMIRSLWCKVESSVGWCYRVSRMTISDCGGLWFNSFFKTVMYWLLRKKKNSFSKHALYGGQYQNWDQGDFWRWVRQMIISGHGHRAAFNNLGPFLSQRNQNKRQILKLDKLGCRYQIVTLFALSIFCVCLK